MVKTMVSGSDFPLNQSNELCNTRILPLKDWLILTGVFYGMDGSLGVAGMIIVRQWIIPENSLR